MSSIDPRIEEGWKEQLYEEFRSDYFLNLKEFLIREKKHYRIFPSGQYIFHAFNATPFHSVKAVVLGQDPYHGAGQAHGLCFSVPAGIPVPPSLHNIFLELSSDMKLPIPGHGNLESWARQGVLLLNAILTVRAHQAGSHRDKGWEKFTDTAIIKLSENHDGLIFLLWGNYAKAKISLIDASKHHILTASHPSPFSAARGFFGCRHFSKTNKLLMKMGRSEINWNIENH